MSSIRINSTEHNREQYTQYLEDQLEKLSSFMLYQKKQNQKYNQLTQLIQDQNDKIKFLNDKVLLLELYQNQNLKNQQKLQRQFQKANSLEKRVTMLEMCSFSNGNTQTHQKRKFNEESQKQMMQEVQDKIEAVRQQILEEMVHIDKNLTQKLNLLIKTTDTSSGSYSVKTRKVKKDTLNNLSPLETNYSENDKSRVNEFDRHVPLTQREMNQNSHKVSVFSNERKPSTLQSQSIDTYHNKVPSIHTEFKDTSVFNHQQRSPISQYLKKQKEYNSSQENTHLKTNSFTTKQFYSECEVKDSKKQKIKSKKSRSKSRSKSERSISNSNRPNTIDNKKKKSKKSKVMKQGMNQNNISRISQKSMSQVSQKSRSRSKSSSKINKRQKKYLMCCKKEH